MPQRSTLQLLSGAAASEDASEANVSVLIQCFSIQRCFINDAVASDLRAAASEDASETNAATSGLSAAASEDASEIDASTSYWVPSI